MDDHSAGDGTATRRIWGKISGVDVLTASVVTGTIVKVRISLHYRDGRRSTTEIHELKIVPCDDHLCIDSDTLLSTK